LSFESRFCGNPGGDIRAAPEGQRLVLVRCTVEIKERRAIFIAGASAGASTPTNSPSHETYWKAYAPHMNYSDDIYLRTAPHAHPFLTTAMAFASHGLELARARVQK
jgi:hypothetical protein